jgi:hypothetical protein
MENNNRCYTIVIFLNNLTKMDILYFECVRNFEDLYVEVPYIIKVHSMKKFIEKSEENLVKNKELYSDYCA